MRIFAYGVCLALLSTSASAQFVPLSNRNPYVQAAPQYNAYVPPAVTREVMPACMGYAPYAPVGCVNVCDGGVWRYVCNR